MRYRNLIKLVFLVIAAIFVVNQTTAATTTTFPATFTSTMQEIENILLRVGTVLGALMITIEGIKWITAQSPPERESAKKGVIYIMIGLILLKSSEKIIQFLLMTI